MADLFSRVLLVGLCCCSRPWALTGLRSRSGQRLNRLRKRPQQPLPERPACWLCRTAAASAVSLDGERALDSSNFVDHGATGT